MVTTLTFHHVRNSAYECADLCYNVRAVLVVAVVLFSRNGMKRFIQYHIDCSHLSLGTLRHAVLWVRRAWFISKANMQQQRSGAGATRRSVFVAPAI